MTQRVAARTRCPWLALGLIVAVIGVLLVVGLPTWPPAPPEAPPSQSDLPPSRFDPEFMRAAALVLAPPDDGRPLEARRVIEAFRRLGPTALPVAIALVCGLESLPELEPEDQSAAPVHPEALAIRDQVLRSIVAESAPAAALEHMVALSEGTAVEVRRVLFQLLGAIDHERALAALLTSARGIDPIHWQRDYICGPFEAAVQARLAARPAGVAHLRSELREMDSALATVVARAAAGVPNKLTMEFALDLLGRENEADLALLQVLARAPQHAALACDETARASVRRLMDAADERVRRAAIDVCGRLADTGAVERLVAELEGADPLLVHAAHRALVGIVRVDQGRTRQAWERWIDAERSWKALEWDGLVAQLTQGDRGRSLAALRVLVAHPLHRDDVAALLSEQAASGAPLDRQQIEALSATRSAAALRVLVDALEAHDEDAAQAALEVLRRFTGLGLDGDPSAWRALLFD